MIELLRYARVKSQGLVSARLLSDGQVCVEFKRFDPENGKEVEPEQCLMKVEDLTKRLAEIDVERAVVVEILDLVKKG